MSLYLGNELISGAEQFVGESRNIGQIIPSTIPLQDAGLHLLDGALIQGGGIYSAFVNYIATLYDNSSKIANVNSTGTLSYNNGILSGFGSTAWALTPLEFNPSSSSWEIQIKFTTGSDVTSIQSILNSNVGWQNLEIMLQPDRISCSSFAGENAQLFYMYASLTPTINTTYYVTVTYTSGVGYSIVVKNSDKETIATGSSNVTTPIVQGYQLVFGVDLAGNPPSTYYYDSTFVGSIDLNESYININGSRWWTGSNPSWATDEAQWQTSVNTYGACGKFVYDSVANTVRLPKITGIIEGTTDVTALGDLVQAGLPNITGGTGLGYGVASGGISLTGAYDVSSGYTGSYLTVNGNGATRDYVGFDASHSSSVYGNSSTVQPQAIKVLYYIVIATSTKTDIQVDIDEVVTDLNGKADVDLTNVNDSGTARISYNASPSDTAENLTFGASGTTYTAPANGWFTFWGLASAANGWMWLHTDMIHSGSQNAIATGVLSCSVKVKKGDVMTLEYGNGTPTLINATSFRFVYDVGSESEAS